MSITAAGLWYWGTYLVPVIFVLGVVVIVHELGHFLVARFFGVTVETFSIGFGPEIACRHDRYGTKWRLAWLPLGGYVKFKGDENAASMPAKEDLDKLAPEDREGNFHTKPLYQRAAVVAAGPVANIILAAVILTFWFLFVGKAIVQPKVVSVDVGSPAELAGIMPGDFIRLIDGVKIESIDDVDRIVMRAGDNPVTIVVERAGNQVTLNATPRIGKRKVHNEVITVGQIGVNWALARVGGVVEGSAAELAGMKPGDIIIQIDDKPIRSFQALQDVVEDSPGKTLQVIVMRGSQRVTLSATPKTENGKDEDGKEKKVGKLGVEYRPDLSVIYERYSPFEAFTRGVAETYFWIQEPFLVIARVIKGKASSDQFGSIIRIAELSHDVALISVADLFHLLAVISIQIGLINLFPIPILDGGHLLFYGIEAIRRRPLSERTMDIGFRIGISLLIMLMLFAMRNDVIHLIRKWG